MTVPTIADPGLDDPFEVDGYIRTTPLAARPALNFDPVDDAARSESFAEIGQVAGIGKTSGPQTLTWPDGETATGYFGPEVVARHEAMLEREAEIADDLAVLQAEALADLRRDAASLEAVLADMRIGACYDQRSRRPWWRSGGGDWRPSTDRLVADLRERIACRYSTTKGALLTFGDDTWQRSINALLHHRETDLFRDWLEALPGWDGEDRLGEWLVTCFEIPGGYDDPLARWASRFVPLAAVTRAYQPGAKIDEIPILLGPQGCGKSTAARLLLPPDEAARYGWFSDSLNLSWRRQAAIRGVAGPRHRRNLRTTGRHPRRVGFAEGVPDPNRRRRRPPRLPPRPRTRAPASRHDRHRQPRPHRVAPERRDRPPKIRRRRRDRR